MNLTHAVYSHDPQAPDKKQFICACEDEPAAQNMATLLTTTCKRAGVDFTISRLPEHEAWREITPQKTTK